jgi:hypothetical protein
MEAGDRGVSSSAERHPRPDGPLREAAPDPHATAARRLVAESTTSIPARPGTTFLGGRKGKPAGFCVRHAQDQDHSRYPGDGDPGSGVRGGREEKTFDWYAQDKHGNVWYLGEDSSDFVNGKWVRSEGSWEAGVKGAKAGIVMKANPRVGNVYRQEYYAGHAEDMAKVLSRNKSVAVTYGSFEHALETSEWTPLERGVLEHKYYVKGVGNVRTIMVKGGSEEEHLVSITR